MAKLLVMCDNQICQLFLLYYNLWLIVDDDSFGSIQISSNIINYNFLLVVQLFYQTLGLNPIFLQQFI